MKEIFRPISSQSIMNMKNESHESFSPSFSHSNSHPAPHSTPSIDYHHFFTYPLTHVRAYLTLLMTKKDLLRLHLQLGLFNFCKVPSIHHSCIVSCESKRTTENLFLLPPRRTYVDIVQSFCHFC